MIYYYHNYSLPTQFTESYSIVSYTHHLTDKSLTLDVHDKGTLRFKTIHVSSHHMDSRLPNCLWSYHQNRSRTIGQHDAILCCDMVSKGDVVRRGRVDLQGQIVGARQSRQDCRVWVGRQK